MNSFQYWHDHIADMPQQDAKGWYDLETGLRYDPNADYDMPPRSARGSISIKAQEARNKAKFLGAKALSGSLKQKEWAEKIRAEKLEQMSEEAQLLVCDKNAYFKHFNTAKFWIEHREKNGYEIEKLALKIQEILHNAEKLKQEYNLSKSEHIKVQHAKIALEYELLKNRWITWKYV